MQHIYANSPNGSVQRARALRRDPTEAEKQLWRRLREALPTARFRRQVPIGPYFADFLSFGARLVVEVDGGQHSEAVEADDARTMFIEQEGYRVIRFWNHEVLGNMDGVLATIAANLPSPLVGEGGAQRRMRG